MARLASSSSVSAFPLTVNDNEAVRISNTIDEEIKRERELLKKRGAKLVKVMLLGQAESGKSTLQKQFQLHYASKSLEKELPSWRPIVLFNIIQAVRTIIETLDSEFFNANAHKSLTPDSSLLSSSLPKASRSRLLGVSESHRARWKTDLSQLRMRLLPLTAIEDALASELCGGALIAKGGIGFVRAGWQSLVSSTRSWPVNQVTNSYMDGANAVSNLTMKTLAMVQDDIEDLWRHPAVKALLKERKLTLQESAAFFFDNIRRIAVSNYMPTTDDVLNVRIQTLGVTEHSFHVNLAGNEVNWLLYDVGGARGQRHAWVPYFDDATAIIFLAPISAFDQYLEEENHVNRIDDSLQLWTMICSNKLLQKAHLVLMLNKTDLLKTKLQAGIMIRKYITSYGDRPNTYEEASEYFRAHFIQVHRRKDIGKRSLYVHNTSMLNIASTQSILANVGEAIIHSHMSQVGLA